MVNNANALIYGEFDTNFLRLNAATDIYGRTEILSGADASGATDTGAFEINNALRIDSNEIITNTDTTLFLQADNNGDVEMDGGTFRMDASANRVGVNTPSPDYTFSVQGVANLNENVASGAALRVDGDEALWYNGTYFSWGFGATANYFADNVGLGTTTPDTRLQIEGGTDVSLGGGGFATFGAVTGWNIAIDDNEIMARSNGGVSTLNLQAEGGTVSVGGAVVHASDRRLKKDIETLGYGLKEILQLDPKKYYWKNRAVTTKKSLGLIAQEVALILPELVEGKETDDEFLAVNYTEIIPVLVNAVKEQQQEIEMLKAEIKSHKSLEARIKALELDTSN